MKNTFLGKLLGSGLQAIAVQVFGGVFFIIISFYLSKSDFGSITWANAIALVLVMVLSFGMDHVVVRRIAASERSDWAAPAYFFHAAVTSTIVFFLLWGITAIGGTRLPDSVRFLPWMFLVQGLLFTMGPLKFFLNAKQRFTPYALIAVSSNTIKLLAAFILIEYKSISSFTVLSTLIGCAAFELVSLLLYVIVTRQFSFYFKRVAYTKLIKEALPQYIAVIFDSSLARADVILIGIMCSSVITAEYGFAYRAYEIAKLPLTVISPIILARFAKMLSGNAKLSSATEEQVRGLFVIEIFLAMMIPLVLNLLWAPALDKLFHEKYGTVNAVSFFILSICIPIQFFINILWTLGFAARKYKENSRIIGITAILNIILNLALIPFYGGNGAAVAFLITCVLQLIGYYKLINTHIMKFSTVPFIVFLVIAGIAYFAAKYITSVLWLQLVIALSVYFIVSLMLKCIGKQHIQTLISFLKNK
ncbi:MAG: oligosaccharide flippase family protein [Bacteroidetes bacterium]|nr:oligosaccharide flippase family protein [Bacteroidota bacterium]